MRYLVTGGCGFVGAAICRTLIESETACEVVVLDNQRRRGVEINRVALERLGVQIVHGDVRMPSDIDDIGRCDWVIDAAAEPSVLAGATTSGPTTTRRHVIEHNLVGTANLLEAAARWHAGVVLLSSSRVYSIRPLTTLPLCTEQQAIGATNVKAEAFVLDRAAALPPGVSALGIDESFTTAAPISMYGATKRASEVLAEEYSHTMGTPLVIDRCGVMAGAGQFGRADQGIFSWWIHSWAAGRPLSFIGFGGRGLQVRDCLHPRDLADLILRQIAAARGGEPELVNVAGGITSATSLAQLSAWCADRFGQRVVASASQPRPYDLPWIVLNHAEATARHGWNPQHSAAHIFDEIARHAERHPEWLDLCGG